MSKAKGSRTRLKVKKYYEDMGYETRIVEKTSKFAKEKDLFGLVFGEMDDAGFDLLGLGNDHIALIQVKTNRPAKPEFYEKFARKYGNEFIDVVVATWYDYKGLKLQFYEPEGFVTELFIDSKDVG